MDRTPSVPDEIYSALRSGNARDLAQYFNANIELAILDKEEVYSKTQAEQILKDFFCKHAPTGFTKLHEGGKDASRFVIGKLSTTKGQYRIYFLMKTINGQFAIHQFRIENDNN
jgi:hypothetical protein